MGQSQGVATIGAEVALNEVGLGRDVHQVLLLPLRTLQALVLQLAHD